MPEPQTTLERSLAGGTAQSPVANAPRDAAVDRPARRSFPKRLPAYTRSLLHVQVPVVVTLAAKKQPIGQILELGPGSIIHFDKPCEDMLDLSVGDCRIAQGEAVKVGDKFGLRVTSLILPEERFQPVKSSGE